jgi:putative DNA primase/helicase
MQLPNGALVYKCSHTSCVDKHWQDFRRHFEPDYDYGKAEQVKPSEAPQWQEPQPLPEDMPAVPRFDYRCLPETLDPWIRDIAERMQCPRDFPAVGAMIVLGSIIGRKVGIRPKRHDDWLEIPNLWGGIIGRVGLLKTPALQQALIHLRRLVARAFEKYEKACRQHDISDMLRAQKKKLVEGEIKKALKESAKTKDASEKEKAENAARETAEKHLKEASENPVCRRYEVNDSTIEKLGELLAENPNGLLLVRDELSGFLRDLDREDRAGDRAKYLEMWDGKGELTYDRIGRGTVRVPSNTLSVLGGIQPDVLMAYIREAVRGGSGNDGLLQRLQLFVWPDVPGDWRNVDEWPDTEAKNQAFDVFEYLDNLTPETVGANTSDGIPFLRFTDEAQECFDAWRAELERKLRSDIEHPAFEAHLAKYRKLLPVLALLLHLAERKTGAVCLDALKKALLWVAYLEPHARRIYSAVLRPDTAAARELAKHLQRGDLPERFKLREVYRKGWAGLNSKEDAEAATEILCDLGWIRPAADAPVRAPGTPGRAASQIFEVNPKIPRHPSPPTDKTDKTDSVSSVSDHQGVSEKSEAAKTPAGATPEGGESQNAVSPPPQEATEEVPGAAKGTMEL